MLFQAHRGIIPLQRSLRQHSNEWHLKVLWKGSSVALVKGGIRLADLGVDRCNWWGMKERRGPNWVLKAVVASYKRIPVSFFCLKKLYLKRFHMGARDKISLPFEKVLFIIQSTDFPSQPSSTRF